MRKKGDRVYLGGVGDKLGKTYYYPYVVKKRTPEKYEFIIKLGGGDFVRGFKLMERNFIEYKFYLQKIIYKYEELPLQKKRNFLKILSEELPKFNKNYFYGLRLKAFSISEVININYYKSLETIYLSKRIKNLMGV